MFFTFRIINFWEVVTLGKKTTNNNVADVDVTPTSPTPDSACIIMYTSGQLQINRPFRDRYRDNS